MSRHDMNMAHIVPLFRILNKGISSSPNNSECLSCFRMPAHYFVVIIMLSFVA